MLALFRLIYTLIKKKKTKIHDMIELRF